MRQASMTEGGERCRVVRRCYLLRYRTTVRAAVQTVGDEGAGRRGEAGQELRSAPRVRPFAIVKFHERGSDLICPLYAAVHTDCQYMLCSL